MTAKIVCAKAKRSALAKALFRAGFGRALLHAALNGGGVVAGYRVRRRAAIDLALSQPGRDAGGAG